jgi:hypothetical protein
MDDLQIIPEGDCYRKLGKSKSKKPRKNASLLRSMGIIKTAKGSASTMSSSSVASGATTTYPILRLGDFDMKPHTDQQSMILNDLTASRQKLAVENQRLRDELQEARLIIRLLKRRLEAKENEENNHVKRSTSAVTSQDTTVKAGGKQQGSNFPALDSTKASHTSLPGMSSSTLSSKKRYLFKPKKVSWREAFMNPNVPGKKMFLVPEASSNNINSNYSNELVNPAVYTTPLSVENTRKTAKTASISVSGLEELSPRSSFTPIRRQRSPSPPTRTATRTPSPHKVSKRHPSATRPQHHHNQQHITPPYSSSVGDAAVHQITSRLQRATVSEDNS